MDFSGGIRGASFGVSGPGHLVQWIGSSENLLVHQTVDSHLPLLR